jgi:hypothetical protein
MDIEKARTGAKDIAHIGILIGLIIGIIFILTWIGMLGCRTLPGWCDIYYGIVGKPKVLIVSGNEGLGNPELLQLTMSDPKILGVRAQISSINTTSIGNLQQFHLVIVEKSKQMSTQKLKMFMEYVKNGGRLVWIGDAGTELTETDELLYEDERIETGEHKILGPWARKDGDEIVGFDELISANYIGNYCEIKQCETELPWVGSLEPEPERKHKLIIGLQQGLPMYGDFTIVNETPKNVSTRVLTVETVSHIVSSEGKDYGNNFPLIITTTPTSFFGIKFGERIAYYAVPPEQFVEPEQQEKYFSIIENMYYGMLQ